MSVPEGGRSFLEQSDSPGEASTQNTVVSDDITSSPPPIPSRSFGRKPTPRPHLFPSLQAAHSHVYRNQSKQSSRDASGDTTQGRVGDESQEEDMTPMTSAFGRSLTTSAQPSVALAESRQSQKLPEHSSSPATNGLMNLALPPFDPLDWGVVPKPLKTVRVVSSDAESTNKLPATSSKSPPYVSGSSVDRIIDQYAHQSSSAAPSQTAVYGSTSDIEHFSRKNEHDSEGILGAAHTQTQDQGGVGAWKPYIGPPRANPGLLRAAKAAYANTPPPQMPLPADPPCRPSSPFFRPGTPRPLTGGPIPRATYPATRQPLSVSDDSYGDEDQDYEADKDENRGQKGQDYGLRVAESVTVSDAESGVAQLTAPPQRMHSARRAKPTRRSMQSTLSSSPVDYLSEESDDDPFRYDVFVRPSKERAVSACLRKVSGLQRESRASIYSEDGTPSKTFGHHHELFGQGVSPEMQRDADASYRIGSPYDNQAMDGEGDNFYNPEAIKSGWAVGSPNELKIPVNKNLFGGAKQNLAEASVPRSEHQLAWEQLRRREEQQANRLTGNTDE